MNCIFKILIGSLFIFSTLIGHGQNETYLLPFSSLLLINPSFAGSNKNTSFHTGNQYYYITKDKTYNQFYATFDTYSDKLKGGVGAWFLHGIIGQENKSTTELGFTYSGFKKKIGEGNIQFSANLGMLIATKQWFAYFLDDLLTKPGEVSSEPGKQFNRYYLLKPGFGFLSDIKSFKFGLSANFPLRFNLSGAEEISYIKNEEVPLSISIYIAKKIAGNRKGLKSSPFRTSPELLIFYNKEFVLSRASVNIKHIDRNYGVFIQNDFTNNIHCFGGTIGYRKNNLSVNLNSGLGIPGISDEIAATFELSLSLIIPPVDYSKITPWAPPKN